MLNCCSFLGVEPPEFLHQSCFSKRIDLASNVFYGIAMMNFLTTICRCWLYYITIRIKYHASIFKNMDVAANGPHPLSDIALRALLVKIIRNQLWSLTGDLAVTLLHFCFPLGVGNSGKCPSQYQGKFPWSFYGNLTLKYRIFGGG